MWCLLCLHVVVTYKAISYPNPEHIRNDMNIIKHVKELERHCKEGPATSSMNSDDWPVVPHVVCAGAGHHWWSDTIHSSTCSLGWDGQQFCVYMYTVCEQITCHMDPRQWREFLKCWTQTLHWHGWSPKKTSLCTVTMKNSQIIHFGGTYHLYFQSISNFCPENK
jgi:hypothetical protein